MEKNLHEYVSNILNENGYIANECLVNDIMKDQMILEMIKYVIDDYAEKNLMQYRKVQLKYTTNKDIYVYIGKEVLVQIYKNHCYLYDPFNKKIIINIKVDSYLNDLYDNRIEDVLVIDTNGKEYGFQKSDTNIVDSSLYGFLKDESR